MCLFIYMGKMNEEKVDIDVFLSQYNKQIWVLVF